MPIMTADRFNTYNESADISARDADRLAHRLPVFSQDIAVRSAYVRL